MSAECVLRATALSKSFGAFPVVQDVSLEVARGEVFALLGPNGAGKTTLIRMLMDIYRPDHGTVEILGGPPTAERKRRIGYLPEERGLYKRERVGELLGYYAALKGLGSAQAGREVRGLVDRLELGPWVKKRVGELSKGMQQKVQFTTALLGNPELLILDEPFSGLDPVNVRLFEEVIAERRAAGATLLLSTHQMTKVEQLCDRALMIHLGRRVLYGPICDLVRQHSDESVIVRTPLDLHGAPGVARVERENGIQRVYFHDRQGPKTLFSYLADQRAEVEEFRHHRIPLEDIFVQVVEAAGTDRRPGLGEPASIAAAAGLRPA